MLMTAKGHKVLSAVGGINVLLVFLNLSMNYIGVYNISTYGCQRHTIPHFNLCILLYVIIDLNIFHSETQR